MLRQFLKHMYPKRLCQITRSDIYAYQHHLVVIKKCSRSYQNQSINAIKFYLEHVLRQDRQYFDLERPKKVQKLPEVLSLEDIQRILKCTTNTKHKALLATLYSAGLRIGELLNLRLQDIDSQHMRIWVREGKGVKDRTTILSPLLLNLLRRYFRQYQPKYYLFEGPGRRRYSANNRDLYPCE